MTSIKDGDEVCVSCEIKLENGEICYKTEEDEYLSFIIGKGKFLPILENELKNMQKGDTKTIILDPEDAFGPYLDDLIIEVPKDMFRSNVELDINSNIKINAPSGKTYYGTVTKMSDDCFTLDLNHPLAGKKISVKLGIVSINEEQSTVEKKSRFQFKLIKKEKKKKSSPNPLKTKSDPSNTG